MPGSGSATFRSARPATCRRARMVSLHASPASQTALRVFRLPRRPLLRRIHSGGLLPRLWSHAHRPTGQGSPRASEIIDDYGAVVYLWLKQCWSTRVGWTELARTVGLHDKSRSLRPFGVNRADWWSRRAAAGHSPDRPNGAALHWRHRSRYRRDIHEENSIPPRRKEREHPMRRTAAKLSRGDDRQVGAASLYNASSASKTNR